jgi:hypothetical protein
MGTHIFNLFELSNLSDLDGAYRLYAAKDVPPDWRNTDDSLKNLNNVVKSIAYQKKIPVALILKDIPYIAIPADQELETLEYPITPDVLTLAPVAGKKLINFKKLDPESGRVALSFLRFALQGPLMSDNRLWKSGGSYYSTQAINYNDNSRETDVYGGFGYRLLTLDGKIYAAVKLTYRYGDRKWLIDRYPNLATSDCKMRHMLYHFGNRLYPVQMLSATGKSIVDQKFIPLNAEPTSVYDYTLQKTGPHPPQWITALDSSSPAITYRNPGSEKRSYGAAALCKLLLRTEDAATKKLHSWSIVPPDKRMERTRSVITRHLSKGLFNGTFIKIADTPLEKERKVFPVPAQLFGQGKVLDVNKNGTALADLGKTRLRFLQNPSIGGLITSSFNAQYLLAPLSMERFIIEDFKNRFEKAMQEFFHGPYSMGLILFDNTKARSLKEQAESIINTCVGADLHGYGILVLPRSAKSDLHNFVKKQLWERVQFQCVTAEKVSNFYQLVAQKDASPVFKVKADLESRYASYLRFTALGHLIVNRKWLWALNDDLHYDVNIGLDVLNNHAAFTFLYNNGKDCFTQIDKSKQREKLLATQMKLIIYDNLKKVADELKKQEKTIRSVILHRDGRTYISEWKGFKAAIEQLQNEQILPKDIVSGIVEVHKTTAYGFRLMYRNSGKIDNPVIGSWEALNDKEGIICTTGEPFPLRGTANPLYITIPYGNPELDKILHDIFALSLLCWATPAGCSKLPINLKLSDELLKPVASDADENEAVYGEMEDTEEFSEQEEERSVLA